MAVSTHLDRREIDAALEVLNQISMDEYGRGLEDLLIDPSPDSALRVQRITGIALKRQFAPDDRGSQIPGFDRCSPVSGAPHRRIRRSAGFRHPLALAERGTPSHSWKLRRHAGELR